MKRLAIILLALSCAAFQGCDFLRTVAGRPTSSDIADIKAGIEAEKAAREAARQDSIRTAELFKARQAALRDSLLLDSLSRTRGNIMPVSRFRGLKDSVAPARYMVVVGSFKTAAYAEKKLLRCTEAGFKGNVLSFRNGLNVVGLCPTDNLSEAYSILVANRGKGVFPKESWILVN